MYLLGCRLRSNLEIVLHESTHKNVYARYTNHYRPPRSMRCPRQYYLATRPTFQKLELLRWPIVLRDVTNILQSGNVCSLGDCSIN